MQVAHYPRNSTLHPLIQALAKRTPPRIHDEFPKNLDWPGGCDKARGEKILRVGYLDASNNPWNTAFMMGLGKFPVSEQMILKRWSSGARFHSFYRHRHSLSLGDYVDLQPGTIIAYDNTVRSVFVNTPSLGPYISRLGSTILASFCLTQPRPRIRSQHICSWEWRKVNLQSHGAW